MPPPPPQSKCTSQSLFFNRILHFKTDIKKREKEISDWTFHLAFSISWQFFSPSWVLHQSSSSLGPKPQPSTLSSGRLVGSHHCWLVRRSSHGDGTAEGYKYFGRSKSRWRPKTYSSSKNLFPCFVDQGKTTQSTSHWSVWGQQWSNIQVHLMCTPSVRGIHTFFTQKPAVLD